MLLFLYGGELTTNDDLCSNVKQSYLYIYIYGSFSTFCYPSLHSDAITATTTSIWSSALTFSQISKKEYVIIHRLVLDDKLIGES